MILMGRAYRSPGLATVTASAWLLIGTGMAAGPAVWRSAPTLTLVAEVAPLRGVGLFCALVGLLQLVAVLVGDDEPATSILFLTGAVLAAAWVAAYSVAAVVGKLAGVAGPVLFAFFCAAQVYQADLGRRR